MYGFTAEQLKKRLKISAVLGVIIEIVLLSIFFIESSKVGLKETVWSVFPVIIMSGFLMTWEIMGLLLNWKKMLKGILFPIPFISFLIELIKAYIMSARAIIYVLKTGGRSA